MSYNEYVIEELKRQINTAYEIEDTQYTGGLFYANVSIVTAMELYQDKHFWMRNGYIVDPTNSGALCGCYDSNDFVGGNCILHYIKLINNCWYSF